MEKIRMTESQQKAYAKYTNVEQLRMIGRSIFFAVRDNLGNLEGFVTIGPNGKTEEDHI